MSDTAYWNVNEEYWNDDSDEDLRGASREPDTQPLREPVEDASGYRDYGSEIESSRPAKGEQGII